MNIKKKIVVILIVLISLCFIGCSGGSYANTVCTKDEIGKDYMEMSYHYFTGYKYDEIKLKDGDTLKLKINVKTKSGNLKVLVKDPKNKSIYSTDTPEKIVRENIQIKEDGKYKIYVQGKHKGSFKISWNIVNK